MKLKGKVALVTGSGSGLGLTMALAFAKEGADVAVNDLHQATANEVAATITREFKRKAIAIKADISVPEEVDAMVERTISELGTVDILVNNAGIDQELVPTIEQSIDNWDRVLNVNLRGTFLCSRRVGQWMVKQNSGVILNIASIIAFGGTPMTSIYGPSKAGMVNLTQALAVEWAKYNIRVNCIAPGYIMTPLLESFVKEGKHDLTALEERTALGRFGKPDEVAKAATFLVSDDASYITGVTLTVDGGLLIRIR